ncbi:MAG: cold shock domain-containing protein [Candidatus Lokiarchaeota archaeon]
MTEKKKGFVKWFSNGKGYGFISTESNNEEDHDNEDVFVHYSNIEMDGFKKLDQGDYVEFEIKEDSDSSKGPEAVNVKLVFKDRRY